MGHKSKGFTLVEIMIVVAIIGLLAAISIPNLFRARVNANEGVVKGNLKTFSAANESYRTVQTPLSYAPDVDTLIASDPQYIDGSWSENPKQGFDFTYAVAAEPAATYAMLAEPEENSGGANSYCVDHTGIIRGGSVGDVEGPATGCTGGIALSS